MGDYIGELFFKGVGYSYLICDAAAVEEDQYVPGQLRRFHLLQSV